MSYMNKNEVGIEGLKFTKESLAELINLLVDKKINSKQAKEMLEIMVETGKTPGVLKEELGFEQLNDESEIYNIVSSVLEENAQSIADYKAGKDRALGYIVGQVMKKSRGKANPAVSKDIVLKLLKEKYDA